MATPTITVGRDRKKWRRTGKLTG